MKDNFVELLIILFSHTTLITFLNLCEIVKTIYNLRRMKKILLDESVKLTYTYNAYHLYPFLKFCKND